MKYSEDDLTELKNRELALPSGSVFSRAFKKAPNWIISLKNAVESKTQIKKPAKSLEKLFYLNENKDVLAEVAEGSLKEQEKTFTLPKNKDLPIEQETFAIVGAKTNSKPKTLKAELKAEPVVSKGRKKAIAVEKETVKKADDKSSVKTKKVANKKQKTTSVDSEIAPKQVRKSKTIVVEPNDKNDMRPRLALDENGKLFVLAPSVEQVEKTVKNEFKEEAVNKVVEDVVLEQATGSSTEVEQAFNQNAKVTEAVGVRSIGKVLETENIKEFSFSSNDNTDNFNSAVVLDDPKGFDNAKGEDSEPYKNAVELKSAFSQANLTELGYKELEVKINNLESENQLFRELPSKEQVRLAQNNEFDSNSVKEWQEVNMVNVEVPENAIIESSDEKELNKQVKEVLKEEQVEISQDQFEEKVFEEFKQAEDSKKVLEAHYNFGALFNPTVIQTNGDVKNLVKELKLDQVDRLSVKMTGKIDKEERLITEHITARNEYSSFSEEKKKGLKFRENLLSSDNERVEKQVKQDTLYLVMPLKDDELNEFDNGKKNISLNEIEERLAKYAERTGKSNERIFDLPIYEYNTTPLEWFYNLPNELLEEIRFNIQEQFLSSGQNQFNSTLDLFNDFYLLDKDYLVKLFKYKAVSKSQFIAMLLGNFYDNVPSVVSLFEEIAELSGKITNPILSVSEIELLWKFLDVFKDKTTPFIALKDGRIKFNYVGWLKIFFELKEKKEQQSVAENDVVQAQNKTEKMLCALEIEKVGLSIESQLVSRFDLLFNPSRIEFSYY